MIQQRTDRCYHCGECIEPNLDLTVVIENNDQAMCCYGCQAVAQSIVDNGLVSYYRLRSTKGVQASQLIPEEMGELLAYDIEEIQQEFVERCNDDNEVTLTVENVSCAACAWLIERKLANLAGLKTSNVNTTTSRLYIVWDPKKLKLSAILLEIAKVGYKAYPFQPDIAEQHEVSVANAYLRKLVIAGLATMQVMMFAMAFYFDVLNTLSAGLANYFRWISLIIVLPVVFYSALPFYSNALSALAARKLNMDVPVSLAILLAFGASAMATVTQSGEVYFESVSMFAFFLLLGRYIEQRAKKKAAQTSSNLFKLVPLTAQQMVNGSIKTVAARLLQPGDHIVIKPGQIIAADGVVISGQSSNMEALLTGESVPVKKVIGDSVYASCENIESPLTIEVSCQPNQRLISKIIKLQEQASSTKPKLASLADSLSQYVVMVILLLASLSYIGWSLAGNPDAFWISLAVLVATCPCALSLATPSAFTCAAAAMSNQGLLLKSGQTFDTLTNVTHVCFDKTGTLTSGKFVVSQIESKLDDETVMSLCAALESSSEHPIANAFIDYHNPQYVLTNAQAYTGGGISGTINGTNYTLGNAQLSKIVDPNNKFEDQVVIYLTQDQQLVATIALFDQIRAQSHVLIDYLTSKNITTTLLTGDSSSHGDYVASTLGMTNLVNGQLPQQKLAYLKTLQQNGEIVAMFGDGVNDAPVLAQAHLSFAMGTGSDIAKSGADVVILHDDLAKVTQGVELAFRVKQIIKQNFVWAIGYNLAAVPFALVGLLPPYLAAAGMSLSSVIVVSNSLRLLKGRQ
ncbi:MAG: cadmium-translocating P-type ATPase [Gammaproteobacteria bacterium]|nr:cadmium-translocating P-type ATPase [Gammaproteobacteria bacterium]